MLAGGAQCWGRNNNYQLGDDTLINRLPGKRGQRKCSCKSGGAGDTQTSCVLRIGNSAQCWGANANGQPSNGSIAANWRQPQEISRWYRDDLIFLDNFQP